MTDPPNAERTFLAGRHSVELAALLVRSTHIATLQAIGTALIRSCSNLIPLLTNVNYVLSHRPLEDDVEADPLQRSARALDAATILFAPLVLLAIAAFRSGALDAELLPLADAAKRAVSLALMARLVLAYAADVLTTRDLLERAGPPSSRSK